MKKVQKGFAGDFILPLTWKTTEFHKMIRFRNCNNKRQDLIGLLYISFLLNKTFFSCYKAFFFQIFSYDGLGNTDNVSCVGLPCTDCCGMKFGTPESDSKTIRIGEYFFETLNGIQNVFCNGLHRKDQQKNLMKITTFLMTDLFRQCYCQRQCI